MQEVYRKGFEVENKRGVQLIPILGLFGIVLVVLISLLLFNDTDSQFLARPYMFPWAIAAGVVIGAPTVYLLSKKQFTIYHPLVYPAFFYFLPAFVFGGLVLMFGLTEQYFLAYVQDQSVNLPYTMLLIILGFAGLTIGFMIPYGKSAGNYVGSKLPVLDWDAEALFFPGIILLVLGFTNNVIGFFTGILGFQRLEQINSYDGLLYLSSLFYIQGALILWMALFRRNKLDFYAVAVGGLLISTALVKAIFSGNRGGLLQVYILIMMAYFFTGRTIKLKQGIILGFAMFAVVIAGMIYGTTFRNIKGSEAKVDASEYVGYIGDTFDRIGNTDNTKVLELGFRNLTERLESVSSLAVVVSNYEELQPYEESYGLDNNIYKDTVTFFIPRIFWKDKPVASEPRRYAELYFDYGENSFTVTPIGDLLRNYGFWGVPLGMLFLGFVIRICNAALLENQPFSYWRSTMFYMVVLGISYEGFFGTIIPYMIKTAFIAVVGFLIIYFFINKKSKTRN